MLYDPDTVLPVVLYCVVCPVLVVHEVSCGVCPRYSTTSGSWFLVLYAPDTVLPVVQEDSCVV